MLALQENAPGRTQYPSPALAVRNWRLHLLPFHAASNAHRKQYHAAGKHGLLRGLDEMQKETSTRDNLHGRLAWLRQDLGIVSIIQSC